MHRNFDNYLAVERAKNSSEHAAISFFSELGQAALTVGLFWRFFPPSGLLAWFGVSACVSFVAFYVHKSLAPTSPQFTSMRWQLANACCSFFVGFSWGLVSVLFFTDDSILYLVFLIALYTGYVSGALAVTFAHQPSFIGFSIGITLPFAGRMFYEGGALYTTIGGMSLFYIAMLTYVSRNMHKLFIDSTRIQYDNLRLVDELAREKEAVEQAVAAKDRFLAAASHDLRQPLNAISLFADALRPLQTEKLGNEIVDKIRHSLSGLNGMLHALLDISRLDAEAIDNQPKHLSLHTMTAQLCDEYREKASHLTINHDVAQDIFVFVDPTIAYRVIRNLIDNGVKYTKNGSISVVAHQLDDSRVALRIEDTGIGIPRDKLASVFDEFQQLNNPERNREKGLGLGLAIVKRLCSIAEIELSLDSTFGHGTTATLILRQGVADVATELPARDDANSLEGRLAVVIDDEKDILLGMQHLLSSWGCDVVVAESMDQALARLANQSRVPELIISDLRLKSGAQGDDAIEGIREEYNIDIPALLITGDTAPEKIASVRDSGLAVIYKPVDPTELRRTISALLIQTRP